MPKFLVEVPHEGTKQACTEAVALFLGTGSHFLTHAGWGCKDGVHKAWITAATIVELHELTLKDIDNIVSHHAS